MEFPSGWYCYMLLCADRSYYTGLTSNLTNRIRDHASGKGSGYTKGTRPVALVWFERLESKQAAGQRERQIKGWNRSKKKSLADGTLVLSGSAQAVWVSLG